MLLLIIYHVFIVKLNITTHLAHHFEVIETRVTKMNYQHTISLIFILFTINTTVFSAQRIIYT